MHHISLGTATCRSSKLLTFRHAYAKNVAMPANAHTTDVLPGTHGLLNSFNVRQIFRSGVPIGEDTIAFMMNPWCAFCFLAIFPTFCHALDDPCIAVDSLWHFSL